MRLLLVLLLAFAPVVKPFKHCERVVKYSDRDGDVWYWMNASIPTGFCATMSVEGGKTGQDTGKWRVAIMRPTGSAIVENHLSKQVAEDFVERYCQSDKKSWREVR